MRSASNKKNGQRQSMTIRLPDDLRQQLRNLAQDNLRTCNSELICILREYLARRTNGTRQGIGKVGRR
jgi:hypothetical protein